MSVVFNSWDYNAKCLNYAFEVTEVTSKMGEITVCYFKHTTVNIIARFVHYLTIPICRTQQRAKVLSSCVKLDPGSNTCYQRDSFMVLYNIWSI